MAASRLFRAGWGASRCPISATAPPVVGTCLLPYAWPFTLCFVSVGNRGSWACFAEQKMSFVRDIPQKWAGQRWPKSTVMKLSPNFENRKSWPRLARNAWLCLPPLKTAAASCCILCTFATTYPCRNCCFRLELFQQIMCRWGGAAHCAKSHAPHHFSERLVQKLQHVSVGTAVSGIHRVS